MYSRRSSDDASDVDNGNNYTLKFSPILRSLSIKILKFKSLLSNFDKKKISFPHYPRFTDTILIISRLLIRKREDLKKEQLNHPYIIIYKIISN